MCHCHHKQLDKNFLLLARVYNYVATVLSDLQSWGRYVLVQPKNPRLYSESGSPDGCITRMYRKFPSCRWYWYQTLTRFVNFYAVMPWDRLFNIFDSEYHILPKTTGLSASFTMCIHGADRHTMAKNVGVIIQISYVIWQL